MIIAILSWSGREGVYFIVFIYWLIDSLEIDTWFSLCTNKTTPTVVRNPVRSLQKFLHALKLSTYCLHMYVPKTENIHHFLTLWWMFLVSIFFRTLSLHRVLVLIISHYVWCRACGDVVVEESIRSGQSMWWWYDIYFCVHVWYYNLSIL